uniref:Uncharacterized protein n=1 Tax=Setaria viridis TaxID=4556 RepID=A0A4U6U1F1_SETVI|nr:hypothetical protein SEVIR_7G286466v2 [Setaria viridis]
MADQLLEAYHGLDEKWRGASRGRFVEMIVMVGCFLLVLMSENGRQEDYAPNDPIFSAHGGPQLESLIADSFPTTRSVEDLKSRYYSGGNIGLVQVISYWCTHVQ